MFSFRTQLRNTVVRAFRFPKFCIALQPILDVQQQRVFAYEALCRGLNNESYDLLTAGMSERSLCRFDRLIAERAMSLAQSLGIFQSGALLSVNIRPSIDDDEYDMVRFLSSIAQRHQIPPQSIILEMTEQVRLDHKRVQHMLAAHRGSGFITAIDDFGAGYAGLSLLATCQADIIKLDRELVRDISSSITRQAIVEGFVRVCRTLGSQLVAEGVETEAEMHTLLAMGVHLMQGYLFAQPALQIAPPAIYPESLDTTPDTAEYCVRVPVPLGPFYTGKDGRLLASQF